MRTISAALAATAMCIGMAGCNVKTSAVPVSANEARVSVEASPRCGPTGAQKLAVEKAAIETINRGFDRFAVMDVGERSVATGVLTAPTTTAFQGNAMQTSPGFSGIARRHQLNVHVLMLRNDDPNAQYAIDAREHLGPDWRKKVDSGGSAFC